MTQCLASIGNITVDIFLLHIFPYLPLVCAKDFTQTTERIMHTHEVIMENFAHCKV